MNFTDAVNEVKETTKRPDLLSRIRREVNSAISFYCLDNEFSRDFAEQEIALDPNEFRQSFLISSMTRFRKFKYLRRAPNKFLTEVTSDDLKNGCYTNDKWYIAGSNVNISMLAATSTLSVGYYMHPPVLNDGSPDFWLLEVAPFMIIDKACSQIFKTIGDERSMKTHLQDAATGYEALRKDQAKRGI